MIINATVTRTRAPLTRVGRYTVTYRVVSADGPPSPRRSPSPTRHRGSPLTPLSAGAAVIVAGAAAVAIARRRARPSTVIAEG